MLYELCLTKGVERVLAEAAKHKEDFSRIGIRSFEVFLPVMNIGSSADYDLMNRKKVGSVVIVPADH